MTSDNYSIGFLTLFLSLSRCVYPVGWGRQVADPYGQESVKARLVNLISAVRTLMRSKLAKNTENENPPK